MKTQEYRVKRTHALLALSGLLLAACSTTAATSAEQPGQGSGMMGHGMAGLCPVQVEGASVKVEDIDGGAGLVFATSGDVAELRRRVAHMVEMINRHGSSGSDEGIDMHGATQDEEAQRGAMHARMMGDSMMPDASARSERLEGGARIVLTPRDPGKLSAVQEHVRRMADKMGTGQCPMVKHGDKAVVPKPPSSPDDPDHATHHPAKTDQDAPEEDLP